MARLIAHLRRHLGQPQLTEMSEHMSKYFKQTRRRRHEGMNEYITRKFMLELARLWNEFSVARLPQQPLDVRAVWSSPKRAAPAMQVLMKLNKMMQRTMICPSGMNRKKMKKISGMGPGHGGNQGIGHTVDGDWGRWSNYDRGYDRNSGPQADSWFEETAGWFLEAHERNMVMMALKNDFSVEHVAQELRNQWPDHDLRQRAHGLLKMFQERTICRTSLSLT